MLPNSPGIDLNEQLVRNGPAILLPFTENQQLGLKLAPGDLIGAYRQ